MIKKTPSILALALSFALAGCVQTPTATPTPDAVKAALDSGSSMPCLNQVAFGFPMAVVPQVGNSFECVENKGFGFALLINPRSKTPMWVAEHLTKENLAKSFSLKVKRDFRPDPNITDKWQASLDDYVGSGYDRGNMASPEDFLGNAMIFSKSFYLTNVVPQVPENRNGIWKRLENNVRQWTNTYGELYVISGPVYKDGNIKVWLGQDKKQVVAAPTHLYKILYAPKQKQMIAFIIPNDPIDAGQLPYYATTVDSVERTIGYNTFPMIPKGTGMVERVDPKFWPIH